MLRLLLLVLLGMLCSCSRQETKEKALMHRADSLMETRPDSALAILEGISEPQLLSSGDKAEYALLLTQARHKNYIPLKNDSLIRIAVDYYGDKKQSLRAAQAYYYWGAVYDENGNDLLAVDMYLKALRLMPDGLCNDFVSILYNNLGGSYMEASLYTEALSAFRKAYTINVMLRKEKNRVYSLRGIAHVFTLQGEIDSAQCYYEKALMIDSIRQDSSWLSILYNDLAIVYDEKEDYERANDYVSKSLNIYGSGSHYSSLYLKAEIMLHLNQLDSARYYYNLSRNQNDIYSEMTTFEGLYRVEKGQRNWEKAVECADIYIAAYDSIQGLSQREELAKLTDKHELEQHKFRMLRHEKRVERRLIAGFSFLLILSGFFFLWIDRKRKKHYITLQQELMQSRVEKMQLQENEEIQSEHTAERLVELREEQLQLCISVFKTTASYNILKKLDTNITPMKMKRMLQSPSEVMAVISKVFVDVIGNLKESYPALTRDDALFCVLSLLGYSNTLIACLMDASPDALKTRKSRIKHKMDESLFERVFFADNQVDIDDDVT